MHTPSRKTLAAGLAAVLTAGLLTASAQPGIAAPPLPEQRVIVVLAGDAAAVDAGPLRSADRGKIKDKLKALHARQDDVLDKAKAQGVRAGQVRRFGLLINAVALSAPADDIAALRRVPGVEAVVLDRPVKAQTDVSVPLVGAPQVWQQRDPSGVAATGTGVTVAVVDTGVDYSHPDLGGGFGTNFKVVGGYDFANGDADPMDDHGHGTHVAGIIGARAAQPGGITGIAPDVRLLAYKVLGANGEGLTSDVVAGIEAAADPANPHRADVINLSLGNDGDGDDPVARASTAAVDAGIVVVASAGNSGPGSATVGSPGIAEGVLAVGASTSNLRVPVAHLVGPNNELVQTYRGALSANPPTAPVTGEVVDIGWGAPEDWQRVGDVRGKIVLVEGYIAQSPGDLWDGDLDLAREAENRGAIALIGGQSGGGPVFVAAGEARVTASTRITASGDLGKMDKLVVMGVDNLQFAEVQRMLAEGTVAIAISARDQTDAIASFSSRGPTRTFGLKPEIVAPGVDIRSTVPTAIFGPGQYHMSGTSMAAPHVAGAAALLRQLTPDRSPADITSALVNTSKSLPGTKMTAAGAGRLDVVAAAASKLTASPSTVSFGLADLSSRTVGGSRQLTLRNTTDQAMTVALKTDGKQATVRPDRVTIAAGATAAVTVTLTADRPSTDGEISGQVTATAPGGVAIHIPYLLVVKHLQVWATPDPSDGHTTVFAVAPQFADIAGTPSIEVQQPKGPALRPAFTSLGGNAYRVDLSVSAPGAYLISVKARTTTGQILNATSGFEVTPVDSRKQKWDPIGPNSQGGNLAMSQTAPQQAIMVQDAKAGPWLTADNGQSWKQLNRLPVQHAYGQGTVIVDARHSERWWYALTDNGVGYSKVLRTDDSGRTWRTLDVPVDLISAFVADPQTRVLVAAGYLGLNLSIDGGEHWITVPTGVTGDIQSAAISKDTLYLATANGVWARTGVLSGNLGPATQVYSSGTKFTEGVVATGDGLVAALVWREGVVGSYNGGAWSTIQPIPSGAYRIHESRGQVFVSTTSGYSWVGRNSGRDWSKVTTPVPASMPIDFDSWADGSLTISQSAAGLYRGGAEGYQRIGVQGSTVFDLAISNGNILAGTYTGSYRTALPVAGPEWGASGSEGYIGDTISQLAVDPTDADVVWRVRRSAFGSFLIDRSADGGVSWQERGSGTEVPTFLAIHPTDSNQVMVGFVNLDGQGVVSTRDGGLTWKNLYHDEVILSAAGDPANTGRWLLGTQSGLYRSDDKGVTRTKIADGFVNTILLSGAQIVVGGATIRVSDDGGRSWRTADTGPLELRIREIIKVGDAFYAATDRGVMVAGAGARNWRNASFGLQNTDVTSLAYHDGALYAGTTDGGAHRMRIS